MPAVKPQPVTRAAVLAAARRKWPDATIVECQRYAGASGLAPLCRVLLAFGGARHRIEARTWAEVLARIEAPETKGT